MLVVQPGRRFLRSLLALPREAVFRYQSARPMLLDEEQAVLDFILDHTAKHGQAPSLDTLSQEVGEEFPEATEPPSFYLEHVKYRHTHNALRQVMITCQEFLEKKQAHEARDFLVGEVAKLYMQANEGQIVPFVSEGIPAMVAGFNNPNKPPAVLTGWGSLDEMAGGIEGGDVFIISGRPASGKTYCTLHVALNAWVKQNKSVLYVSMEMKPALLVQRLAAMFAKVPVTPLKKGTPQPSVVAKITALAKAWDSPDKSQFWIMDGRLASTVDDIAAVVHQLAPQFVVIDGAYLVRPSRNAHSDWERIKQVVEDMKRMAEFFGLPLLASYQLNRDAAKKKKDDTYGVEVLAGSDAIGQIATVVLAMQDIETIESLAKKRVSIIKGRNGEDGEFWISWVFDQAGPNGPMDFGEIENALVANTQFDVDEDVL